MAFSSVAHAGYLLLGMLCMTPAGYAGAMFYGAAVLPMKYTCITIYWCLRPHDWMNPPERSRQST